LDPQSVELLRAKLQRLVDQALDEWFAPLTEQYITPVKESVVITDHGPVGPFKHLWPSGDWESYHEGREYEVTRGGRRVLMKSGIGTRPAFGRARRRIVIFQRQGSVLDQLYPLAEFVETDSDDGGVAALVPDPRSPRKFLKHGDSPPQWCAGRRVDRTDRLFRSVQNGPSMRLVVPRDDFNSMVEHAFWVGTIRERFG